METFILFMRHELHENNRLTANGIERARRTGLALKKKKLLPNKVASSPQWRCIQTIQYVLDGAQSTAILTRLEERFGDLEMDLGVPVELKSFVKARTEELQISKEHVMLGEEVMRPHIRRRGVECAAAILDLVHIHTGETILACSHGGSRMEPAICMLLGVDVFSPPYFFEQGSVALLRFSDLLLLSAEYLGHLT